MKDNFEKSKIPWYVRYTYWAEKFFLGKAVKIIFIMIFLIASVISYGILKARPATSYNEFYDIEFKDYINTKLEDISNRVIVEGCGIELDKIPQIVEEYTVIWREEGIEFSYVLSTEKIVSEYYKETGKNPKVSYLEEEFRMDIYMSKDFKNINKKSSIKPPDMTQEEFQQEYPKRTIIDALWNGATIVFIVLIASMPILFFTIFPAYASDKWSEKHQMEYNEYFQKNN